VNCIDFLGFVEMMEVVRIVVVRFEIVVGQEGCVDSSVDIVEEHLVAIDIVLQQLKMDEHRQNEVGSPGHLEVPMVNWYFHEMVVVDSVECVQVLVGEDIEDEVSL
jgi:hypothetical protein